jgi:hypothetical protein
MAKWLKKWYDHIPLLYDPNLSLSTINYEPSTCDCMLVSYEHKFHVQTDVPEYKINIIPKRRPVLSCCVTLGEIVSKNDLTHEIPSTNVCSSL